MPISTPPAITKPNYPKSRGLCGKEILIGETASTGLLLVSLIGTAGAWSPYRQQNRGTVQAQMVTSDKTLSYSKQSHCKIGNKAHVFIFGSDIIQTLWMNIIPEDKIGIPIGVPIWEMMPTSFSDKKAIENATNTYLGNLVLLTRYIKLLERGMIIGDGISYNENYRDSYSGLYKHIKNKKEEIETVGFSHEKSIWRNLHSILSYENAVGDKNLNAPLQMGRAPALNDSKDINIWVGGIIANKSSYQKSCQSWFNIPKGMMLEQNNLLYLEGVKFAEQCGDELKKGIQTYYRGVGCSSDKNKLAKAIYKRGVSGSSVFWAKLETLAHVLIKTASEKHETKVDWNQNVWGKLVKQTMMDIYQRECPTKTAKQFKAFVQGEPKI